MAEQFQHPCPPAPVGALLQRITLSMHRHLTRFTALAFVGGSAVLGVETFNLVIALWPVYPTAVPVLLIGCAVAVGLARLLRGAPRDASLTFRPSLRRSGRRLDRRLR